MKWLFTALAIIYMISLWVLSSNSLPDVGIELFFMDKVAHFLAFAIMAILILKALLGWQVKRSYLLSGVIAFLYGVIDETHQYFVPSRNCDLMDLLADGIGIFTVLFFFYWLERRRREKGICN